jgi:hypothetical protein
MPGLTGSRTSTTPSSRTLLVFLTAVSAPAATIQPPALPDIADTYAAGFPMVDLTTAR